MQTTSPASAPEKRVDASLYRQYKHCTGAVLQWGYDTWTNRFEKTKKNAKQKKKKKKKKTQAQQDDVSLTVYFDRLEQLAEAGVCMPVFVYNQLQTAIQLREKVGRCYKSMPSASESSLESHEWIIQQLRIVHSLFADADASRKPQETQVEPMEYAFAALITDDDELSVEDHEKVAHHVEDENNLAHPLPCTKEQITEEDRYFAIVCTMVDIAGIRSDVRDCWKRWATAEWTSDDGAEVGELVATSVLTNYACKMVEKLVVEASLEVSFEDIRLFLGGDETFLPTVEDSDQTGGTIRSLKEIYAILKQFDFASVPQEMYDVKFFAYKEEPKEENRTVLQPALTIIEKCRDDFRGAVKQRNIPAFTSLLVEKYFPIWLSYSHSACKWKGFRIVGAHGAYFASLLAHWKQTGKLSLALPFFILVLADSCFEQEDADPGRADAVKDLEIRVLNHCVVKSNYDHGNLWLKHIHRENTQREGVETTQVLFKAFHEIDQYIKTWSPMSLGLPLLSGSLLIHHLGVHLQASRLLTMLWRKDIHLLVHMYHMLRAEGFLERIPRIEETVIGMFNQKVFFRAGLPKRGDYSMNLNYAFGMSPSDIMKFKRMKGRRGASFRPIVRTDDGMWNSMDMNGDDVSRLLQIMHWKTGGSVDVATCFDEIHRAATRECPSLFMVPLMEVTIILKALMDNKGTLLDKVLPWAEEFMREKAPDALATEFVSAGKKNHRLTWWATMLGDSDYKSDVAIRDHRIDGLSCLGQFFSFEFKIPEVPETDWGQRRDIVFTFNTTAPVLDEDERRSYVRERRKKEAVRTNRTPKEVSKVIVFN